MLIPLAGRPLYRATAGEFIGFIIAYLHLLAARSEARERGRPSGTNTVPLRQLRSDGVTDKLVLWMLYQGHIAHVHPAGNSDSATLMGSLQLVNSSAFYLTDLGEEFADQFVADALLPLDDASYWATRNMPMPGLLTPAFDRDSRTLRWGARVLKCFRQPSVNQELILRAAEELHWPFWFDDPLPRGCRVSAKTRLHDTIKDLNRRQRPYLIHFKGDGTGTRIGWEFR